MNTNPEYQRTLEYLYEQLPMYHRIGPAAYKANLDNTHAICRLLRHPETKFRSVHIAGTNGKGSVSHMLAAVYQAAGYKTGLYTSPHLVDFRERIRIDGVMIPEEEVSRFVGRHKADFSRIQPSFFEWTVGLAFDYFAREKVDIAVIETGLGGRLDSTNVVRPELSVITNIGRDHLQLLGDTMEMIAKEKAGIIKEGTPVVVGERQPEISGVFLTRAEALNAPLVFASDQYVAQASGDGPGLRAAVQRHDTEGIHYYELDLAGMYQLKNLVTVLQSVEELRKLGWRLEEGHVAAALKNVSVLTGLAGRWQLLATSPDVVADVAHNEDGIREVLACVQRAPHHKLHVVLGMVNDKQTDGVLDLLPVDAHYYFCRAAIPRALDAATLQQQAAGYGLKGDAYGSVREALEQAKRAAGESDLVLVTGSTFVVAEVV